MASHAAAMAATMRIPWVALVIRSGPDAVLGEGRSARVISGTWNGYNIALKMFSGHLLGFTPPTRAVALRAHKSELGFLLQLRHPGILEVFGWTESPDGSSFGIVMDRAYGDLFQQLQALRSTGSAGSGAGKVPSGLTVAAFLVLGRGVCGALAAMHMVFIIHRDIKSPNILMKAGGSPMICDLGVARAQVTVATALGPSCAASTTAATPATSSASKLSCGRRTPAATHGRASQTPRLPPRLRSEASASPWMMRCRPRSALSLATAGRTTQKNVRLRQESFGVLIRLLMSCAATLAALAAAAAQRVPPLRRRQHSPRQLGLLQCLKQRRSTTRQRLRRHLLACPLLLVYRANCRLRLLHLHPRLLSNLLLLRQPRHRQCGSVHRTWCLLPPRTQLLASVSA